MLIADLLYTFVSFNMTTSMCCSSMIWLILSDLDLKPLTFAYKKLHNPVLHAVCRLAELLDFLPLLIFPFLHLETITSSRYVLTCDQMSDENNSHTSPPTSVRHVVFVERKKNSWTMGRGSWKKKTKFTPVGEGGSGH